MKTGPFRSSQPREGAYGLIKPRVGWVARSSFAATVLVASALTLNSQPSAVAKADRLSAEAAEGGDTSAKSKQWNQWRGPERDGSWAGSDWPDDFKGLQRLWRVELGKGYASPLVDSERVYVASTEGGKTEMVRALSRSDGTELWRASWPGEGSVPFFAAKNGDWIRSTPALDGDTLYVGGMNELFVALDAATGEERWRVDFPARFGTEIPPFGFSSSPLVDGDSLFVQAADSLVKLEKGTGSTVWRSLVVSGGMMNGGAFSSPVIADLHGRRQLVVASRTALHGVDLEDGTELWSHEVPTFRGMNIVTPSVFDSSVFTSSHREGSFLYQVSESDGQFEAQELWKHKAQGYMSSPVLIDGFAYLHLGNGRLTCIRLSDGSERWTSTPFGSYWSMAFSQGKLLALDEEGSLHLVRANPERFELLDSAAVADQPSWAHLALFEDELYVRDLGGLSAFRWPAVEPVEALSPKAAP